MDGLFSWEAAWPERAGYGGAYPGDVGPDAPVAAGAEARGKDYMVGLSALQYKDAVSVATRFHRDTGTDSAKSTAPTSTAPASSTCPSA